VCYQKISSHSEASSAYCVHVMYIVLLYVHEYNPPCISSYTFFCSPKDEYKFMRHKKELQTIIIFIVPLWRRFKNLFFEINFWELRLDEEERTLCFMTWRNASFKSLPLYWIIKVSNEGSRWSSCSIIEKYLQALFQYE
jgi:hypothetical protein